MKDILREVKKQGGVILEAPKKEDAIFNVVFGEVIAEPFNWTPYLPSPEVQKRTAFCVSFSRLNCAEAVAKKNNQDLNLSDRHLGVGSKTTLNGNSLRNVSEYFRKSGIVKEEFCKFKDEWLENPSKYWKQINALSIPLDAQLFKGGNHSWVYGKAAMKQALAFSPLQLAVGVGNNWGHTFINDPKEYETYHAVMLYWIDGAGNYFIYDSAGDSTKTLDKNYNIMQCKSFADLPENWKEIKDPTLEAIRAVFGPTWISPAIFYRRKLVSRGIFGACRVGGSSTIPPYRVFLIGNGGFPINSPEQFQELFGTLIQTGIVGIINPEQARMLGITAEVMANTNPIILKNSWIAGIMRLLENIIFNLKK